MILPSDIEWFTWLITARWPLSVFIGKHMEICPALAPREVACVPRI
jgi:hypothetical protein